MRALPVQSEQLSSTNPHHTHDELQTRELLATAASQSSLRSAIEVKLPHLAHDVVELLVQEGCGEVTLPHLVLVLRRVGDECTERNQLARWGERLVKFRAGALVTTIAT